MARNPAEASGRMHTRSYLLQTNRENKMIGAILLGLIAGTVGRLLVPDMWSELSGPKSWFFSLCLGLSGAILGYLIFTVGLGIGDSNVFDLGGLLSAIIGVIILLPFVGIFARLRRGKQK